MVDMGLKSKDALYVASAIEGEAQYFLTTDDTILKKLAGFCKDQAHVQQRKLSFKTRMHWI